MLANIHIVFWNFYFLFYIYTVLGTLFEPQTTKCRNTMAFLYLFFFPVDIKGLKSSWIVWFPISLFWQYLLLAMSHWTEKPEEEKKGQSAEQFDHTRCKYTALWSSVETQAEGEKHCAFGRKNDPASLRHALKTSKTVALQAQNRQET